MFTRKKGKCFYVVENHRVNGKVRQQIIACLGETTELDEALASLTLSVQHQRESVSRPWIDDATRFPHRWRKDRQYVERKLSLDLNRFIARRRHISSLSVRGEHRVKYEAAFYQWADPQIDAYLQQNHEKDIEKQVRKLAKTESQLTRLWEIVPESDRPAMEAKVLEKMRQKPELWGYINVVPESCSALPNAGTTEAPELFQAGNDVHTTEGATLADLVPEMRSREQDSGTTNREVNQ